MATAINEELELVPERLQVDLVGRQVIEILPLTSNLKDNISFRVNNNINKHYIDVNNLFIEMTLKLTKKDGTAITKTDVNTGFVNNIFHSLFQNVEVKLNQKTVTDSDQNYHYLAYITKLMSYSPEFFETQGALFGWAKDEATSMDSNTLEAATTKSTATIAQASVTGATGDVAVIKTLDSPGNPMTIRTGWFFDNYASATTTYHDLVLFDKLMVTPFTQDKLLPYGVELFLTLERAKPEFYLMASTANTATAAQIEIKDIKLHVPYVKLSDPTFLSLETGKASKSRRMPIVRSRVIRHPIAQGTIHPVIQHLFAGRSLPQKILVGFVTNKAESGFIERNPFNFNHNNVAQIQIFKNGQAYPRFPFRPDFTKKMYVKEFASVFDVANVRNVNVGFPINYDEYPRGFCFYGFDLTGDQTKDDDVGHLREYGDITFDVVFKTAPGEAITMVVFAEYEEELILDGMNNVRVSWDG